MNSLIPLNFQSGSHASFENWDPYPFVVFFCPAANIVFLRFLYMH